MPRRTVLELLLSGGGGHPRRISLSDLLFQLPPLHPRYYSIASSNSNTVRRGIATSLL